MLDEDVIEPFFGHLGIEKRAGILHWEHGVFDQKYYERRELKTPLLIEEHSILLYIRLSEQGVQKLKSYDP